MGAAPAAKLFEGTFGWNPSDTTMDLGDAQQLAPEVQHRRYASDRFLVKPQRSEMTKFRAPQPDDESGRMASRHTAASSARLHVWGYENCGDHSKDGGEHDHEHVQVTPALNPVAGGWRKLRETARTLAGGLPVASKADFRRPNEGPRRSRAPGSRGDPSPQAMLLSVGRRPPLAA